MSIPVIKIRNLRKVEIYAIKLNSSFIITIYNIKKKLHKKNIPIIANFNYFYAIIGFYKLQFHLHQLFFRFISKEWRYHQYPNYNHDPPQRQIRYERQWKLKWFRMSMEVSRVKINVTTLCVSFTGGYWSNCAVKLHRIVYYSFIKCINTIWRWNIGLEILIHL